MPQTISTTTTVAPPVDYANMRGLLRRMSTVNTFFNGTLQGRLEENQGTKSVKWRRIEKIATGSTALAEASGAATFGLGRDAVTPTITDLTVAVAKHGKAIIYNEELDLFNVNSRAAQLMDVLGENAGDNLNVLMRDVYNAETTARFGNGVASTALTITALTAGDIRHSVNRLKREGARPFFAMGTGSTNVGSSPVRQSFMGIVHSDVEEDIRDITGFIGVEQYGGYTETFVGEFGAVRGVRFCSTSVAPIAIGGGTTSASGFRGTTNTLNDVYSTFIYGQEAVGSVGLGEKHTKEIYMSHTRPSAIDVINHAPGSSGIGDMFNEAGSIAWKAWFAGKVLNSNWIRKVETLASDL